MALQGENVRSSSKKKVRKTAGTVEPDYYGGRMVTPPLQRRRVLCEHGDCMVSDHEKRELHFRTYQNWKRARIRPGGLAGKGRKENKSRTPIFSTSTRKKKSDYNKKNQLQGSGMSSPEGEFRRRKKEGRLPRVWASKKKKK